MCGLKEVVDAAARPGWLNKGVVLAAAAGSEVGTETRHTQTLDAACDGDSPSLATQTQTPGSLTCSRLYCSSADSLVQLVCLMGLLRMLGRMDSIFCVRPLL